MRGAPVNPKRGRAGREQHGCMDMDGCGAAWQRPVGCALRLGHTEACDRLRCTPGAARRRGARLWDMQSGRGGCPHPGTANAADRRSSREAAPPGAGRRSLFVHIGRGATPLSGRAEPGGPVHTQRTVSEGTQGAAAVRASASVRPSSWRMASSASSAGSDAVLTEATSAVRALSSSCW